jgi:protoporphyrinogen oxidase
MTSKQRWCVIGGGILGMHTADRLARAGHEVVLLEAAPALGGLASAWTLGDIVWDKHYHVILPTDSRTLGMVDELGLTADLAWSTVPSGCQNGDVVYPAGTVSDILRLPFLGLVAKLRLGLTAARAMTIRRRSAIEKVLVIDWLRRWSGRQATERFWIPLLRSKLSENASRTSAAFIWATIRRLVSARRHGGAGGDGFGYVRGGYAVILDAYAKRLTELGVRVECGVKVARVGSATGGGVQVDLVDGELLQFDRVVVTAASPIAAKLCPELTAAERERCEAVTYQGIVCLSLLLKAPLTPYYLTYLTSEAPFTTVIDMSSLVDAGQIGGHGLIYLPRYIAANDPLANATAEEVAAQFLPALARLYPSFSPDDVLASRLSTVRYVMPVPTLNYSKQLPPIRTSIDGLFLVSSAHIVEGTLNADETLRIADAALPVLLGAS